MLLHQKLGIVTFFKALLIASIPGFPVIALTGCASPTKPDPDKVMEAIDYSRFEGRIAFSRSYNTGPSLTDPYYLVVVDATQKTSKLTRVHGLTALREASVALSPITDQLVFSTGDLYILDSNGVIVKLADNGIYPVFTHDGQWVLYQVGIDYSYVYRIKPDGTANTQLFIYGKTRYIGGRISPSPDGSRITFPVNTGAGGFARVCIANLDGTGYREIVKAGDHESLYGTAWSSLGGRIACVSRRGYNEGNPSDIHTILSVDTSGSNPDTIFQGEWEAGDPYLAWSPDDSKIAFNWRDPINGSSHIFVVDTGGGAPVQITSGNSWDSGPCWVR
jgi:Tol biopolymer transport system component